MGSLAEVFFSLSSEVRNEAKESLKNERAIAPGTQLFLLCPVGESVGRGTYGQDGLGENRKAR